MMEVGLYEEGLGHTEQALEIAAGEGDPTPSCWPGWDWAATC
jgi:hypothetical protein